MPLPHSVCPYLLLAEFLVTQVIRLLASTSQLNASGAKKKMREKFYINEHYAHLDC